MNSSNPNFSIVIPNFNGAKYLPDCFHSLLVAIKNCPQSSFEIILVDNASSDNSVDLFKSLNISNNKFISLPKNFGFAAAVNRGIEASTHDFIVVCNNDLTLSPDWFALISEAIKKKQRSEAYHLLWSGSQSGWHKN